MPNLNELIKRHQNLLEEQSECERALGNSDGNNPIAEEIVSSASSFLDKLKPIASRLVAKFPASFALTEGRLVVKEESRSIPFTYDTAMEISLEAVKTINETIKGILQDGLDRRSLSRLGVALNSFYQIVDGIEDLERKTLRERALEAGEKRQQFQAERKRIENEFRTLDEDINAYFSSLPKNPRSVTPEEALSILAEHPYSHDIDLGVLLESAIPESFMDHVASLGYTLDGYTHFRLSTEGGKNVALIDASPEFLEDNRDFKNRLKDLVFRSFLNFEPKMYQVAFIEGSEGEVILNPLASNIASASPDYVYGKEAADEPRESAEMISRLQSEVRDRIAKFEEAQKSYSCVCIEDYNEHNGDNPFKYIFLLIKDYPEGFTSKEMNKKLEYIIKKGDVAGIMVLLIGKNEEIEVGYNNILKPLSIPESAVVHVDEQGGMSLAGKPFALLSPLKENSAAQDIEFLQLRYKKASVFTMETILEDHPAHPFYDEISIPLGKSGGELFSLVSHTEKSPVPFVLVTGATRTGKSAFMHLIMLSAAYKYSPDELEFHVIDFKSAESSTEFANYQVGRSMYIPHVKYLSLKSRPENAVDIIHYIQKIKSSRNRFGKFRQYNSTNPEKKMPMIYVIIDEYESMLSGGEANDKGDIESITLKNAIQKGITDILKKAAVYGIGVIFSGQAIRGLPDDARAQISTMIAFNNRNNTDLFYTLFPGQKVDLSLFPEDDFRGLAFTANVNRPTPRFTKFAWAGNEESMAKMAKRIREKYPEATRLAKQTIIGGTASAEIRLDSYLPWKDEIALRLDEERGEFDSEEEFISSCAGEDIERARPIAIGQSASSELTVYLEYKMVESARAYYAFGRTQNLLAIERNALLSFLYQMACRGEKGKHVLFLDGSPLGVKDSLLGSLLEKHPRLSERLEYISDKREMAKALLKLEKHKDETRNGSPYLVILHELDWLNSKDALPDPNKKVEETKDSADEGYDEETRASAMAMGGPMGGKMAAMFGSFGFASFNKQKKEKEKEEFPTYNAGQLKAAFKELYLNGSPYGVFLLASSSRYEVIRKEVLSLSGGEKSIEESIEDHCVYGSFEMKQTKQVGNGVNANICFALNGDLRSTTRLFNYEKEGEGSAEIGCSAWWERMDEIMEK